MELYCAIDVLGGTAVRLFQGDFDRKTDHGDPLSLAMRYVDAGARVLHVVDLDAARDGARPNIGVLARIVADAGVPVQIGGGVRAKEDFERLLDMGAARVVVTTVAVENPDLVSGLAARFPGRLALGIDHRSVATGIGLEGPVAVRGWGKDGSASVGDLLERFATDPIGAVVVTSIDRDGTMAGPDLDGLVAVLRTSPHAVIASGGIRSASDLKALADLGVAGFDGTERTLHGAIVGRAIAEGSLAVSEALEACERSG